MASLFEKAKRKLSGDSPKEGQKESKQTKMVAIPLTGITEAEQDPHEGDLIGTLHIIMEEIEELKQGQNKSQHKFLNKLTLRLIPSEMN